jgi:tRNA pseudouridine55 synthase
VARKRKGDPIHGWLIIDKPAGLTSSAVVGKVKRALNAAKAGHGGTLDPMATGVLPLALGEATKTVAYVMDGAKEYAFTVRWGEARNTDDAEGEVTETSPKRPTAEEIGAALGHFTGRIDQVPPDFSAIKVNGKRAYALARADQAVELKPRPIDIHSFELVDQPTFEETGPDEACFRVISGKGAYMRALARDLALKLGTFGHISALRRVSVGPFGEDRAISLDNLETLSHSAPLEDLLLPVETALADIPALALTAAEAQRLRNGQPLPALPVLKRLSLQKIDPDDVMFATAEGKPVALVRIQGSEIRSLRVLNV